MKKVKKRVGRPRSVSHQSAPAATASTRLSPEIMNLVERWAAEAGKLRSDIIRELIEEAVAARKKKPPRR